MIGRLSPRAWLERYRSEAGLFVLLFASYAYFYQSAQHNESARFDQMRALAYDHTLAIDRYSWMNTADVIEVTRHDRTQHFPNKAPGTALAAFAPFCFWSLILRAFGWPDWIHWHLVAYATVVSTVGLASALSAVAMFVWLTRVMGAARRAALLAVLSVWLGTLAFPFSTVLFSHQLTAAELVFSFVIVASLGRVAHSPRTARWAALCAGGLAGHSMASEYPSVLLAAWIGLLGAILALRASLAPGARARLGGLFASGVGLGLGWLLIYNWAAFGDAFFIPYQAYAAQGAQASFPVYSRGILGLAWPGWSDFFTALKAILLQSEIGLLWAALDRRGLYVCNPVLWLVVPGLAVMLWRRALRLYGVIVLGMLATYLTFNACYGTSPYDWGGGGALGPRHLIPLLPFLALPLAALGPRMRVVCTALLLPSAFYMLLATAIEPRIPIGTGQAARDIHLPHYLRGHLSVARDGLFDPERRLLTRDSTAFNWGKLLGLAGQWQLAPLLSLSLVLGCALLRWTAAADGGDGQQRAPPVWQRWSGYGALAIFVAVVLLLPVFFGPVRRASAQGQGLTGRYFANAEWRDEALAIVVDETLDFDWRHQMPLSPPFSIEWTGALVTRVSGVHVFTLESDDGASLEIDGRLLIDDLGEHGARNAS
ncbi:MAG: PA14 domain-containing protein, partial [Vicinamibacteria bacterium]|nr:PA14 domain-containing protein [Vicinamibacteria bacterium]